MKRGNRTTLKGEKLIIFHDPQRMIRGDAQAVDGRAKGNGFSVLFAAATSNSG